MSKVSVIIPVFNSQRTIRETINSVLNQTHSDLEIIVIDDGSQDSTAEIVSAIDDPRIRLFSYPNAGQAESRNRGIAKASGNYIAFLDADDLWTPDKLEAQLKALAMYPKAAVAYSWVDRIDERGQFIGRGSYISVSGDVYSKLLLIDFLENGSNPLVRTQAISEVGGFDPSLVPAEDWDLWLKLARKYEFAIVPSVQVLYRISTQSISASANVKKLENASIKVINRAFAEAPETLQFLKTKSQGNMYKYLAFKALDNISNRQNAVLALKFLNQSIKHDPKFARSRTLWKALAKIAVVLTMSPSAVNRYPKLFDTRTLLGYFQLDTD